MGVKREKAVDAGERLCYTSFYLSAGRVSFRARKCEDRPAIQGGNTGRSAAKFYKEVPNKWLLVQE